MLCSWGFLPSPPPLFTCFRTLCCPRDAFQIPDGLLVFFPSYYVMTKCVQTWTSDGTCRRMERFKAIVVEPRTSGELAAVASAFRDAVDSGRGAIFFAVCRGKVRTHGEGLGLSCGTAGEKKHEWCRSCSLFLRPCVVVGGACGVQVSEGIDFPNKYGRAVVITGLPYPPYKVCFDAYDDLNTSCLFVT